MDPMDNRGGRERLQEMRNGLLRLHKSLLESQRAIYERDVARITSAGQYLALVMDDPMFAWLRELSQFIVMVDEALDLDEAEAPLDAGRLMGQARELIAPSEHGAGFSRRYYELMQSDPAAVLAHRDMMRVFNGLA